MASSSVVASAAFHAAATSPPQTPPPPPTSPTFPRSLRWPPSPPISSTSRPYAPIGLRPSAAPSSLTFPPPLPPPPMPPPRQHSLHQKDRRNLSRTTDICAGADTAHRLAREDRLIAKRDGGGSVTGVVGNGGHTGRGGGGRGFRVWAGVEIWGKSGGM